MSIWKPLLLVGLLLAVAPAVSAEPMPLPLEPAASSTGAHMGEPGFSTDVEYALNDLTRLQCRLLGLVMINSQPCPVR